MLSRACEYGIKAVICLSITSESDVKKNIGSIARNIQSPEAFTAKVLQKLVKAGIVKSTKGKNGGFYIEEQSLSNLRLWDVVEVIDGEDLKYRCLLGISNCFNSNPCPVHESYKKIRTDLIKFLKETSIVQLSERVVAGEGVLRVTDNFTNKINNKFNEKDFQEFEIEGEENEQV